MKPFVKVCESKVLRRGIVVCCGPKPAIRKLFLDPGTFSGFSLSKRFLAMQWRSVEKAWDEALGEPGGAYGFTMRDGGDVFVVLPKWDSRVFVHEAYHAAQAVLRIIGTQDEELGAFLVEWLFEEICWTTHTTKPRQTKETSRHEETDRGGRAGRTVRMHKQHDFRPV